MLSLSLSTPVQSIYLPMDPKSRLTPAGQPVYEDVEPQYRWVPEKDADKLTVDLTGFKGEAEFKKEHLKVKIDTHGNLKVSGERPLPALLGAANRWRRFQKVFRMAEDCNTSEIRAKFDKGVLSVIMPKLVKDRPSSPPPAAAQTPSAAPAPESRKAPEEGKRQAETAAEKPAPASGGRPEGPSCRAGTRRRPRWVAVAVVAVVAVATGLGFYHYYWSCRNGVNPDEGQQLEVFGDY